jgi:ketosteroid isomerase-like protein
MTENNTWLTSDELPLADGKIARGEFYADSAKAAKLLG